MIAILLILQRVLSANQIRVHMEPLASMTDSTDAVARILILENSAHVSIIVVIYILIKYIFIMSYIVCSGSVTVYYVIPSLSFTSM